MKRAPESYGCPRQNWRADRSLQLANNQTLLFLLCQAQSLSQGGLGELSTAGQGCPWLCGHYSNPLICMYLILFKGGNGRYSIYLVLLYLGNATVCQMLAYALGIHTEVNKTRVLFQGVWRIHSPMIETNIN